MYNILLWVDIRSTSLFLHFLGNETSRVQGLAFLVSAVIQFANVVGLVGLEALASDVAVVSLKIRERIWGSNIGSIVLMRSSSA